jgi:sigma-B regulation protein RsbU (phosphoserine phosphatase)
MWRRDGDRVRCLTEEAGAWWPSLDGAHGHAIATPQGEAWLEPIVAQPGVWLQLGPDDTDPAQRAERAKAAATLLGQVLVQEREMALVVTELTTRYEEINLLYTISDILGHTVRLEEAAQTIIREVSDVVGARRASLMVHDVEKDELRVVAARGLKLGWLAPVPVQNPDSIAARAFREQRSLFNDPRADGSLVTRDPTRGYVGESYLSVPILYAPPGGTARPIGVINLTDRLGDDHFTSGHKKLIFAIANQVGAAIENARLAELERQRERLRTELDLARELQLALMPSPSVLAKSGDIGARSQSAEFVGGDFFDLIPLGRDAVGVMIGDVSGHGLRAAMVMAHAVSAAGVLALGSQSPEDALQRLVEIVGEELRRAEMHLSLFYGVVDRRKGTLHYANAGHPHAFVVPGDGGTPHRLAATAPPLGLGGEKVVLGSQVAWTKGRDILCLFTDGLNESLGPAGERYGEQRVLATVRANVARPAPAIVEAVFGDLESFAPGAMADDRTLLVLRR